MTMQDPIADMLTRIRNAQAVGEREVRMPSSTFKKSILSVLKDEGYIEDYSVENEKEKASIVVTLKYYMGQAVISKIKKVSKPGLRIYKRSAQLPSVLGGLGTAIISTSKGLMTDKAARAQNLGGEVICVIE